MANETPVFRCPCCGQIAPVSRLTDEGPFPLEQYLQTWGGKRPFTEKERKMAKGRPFGRGSGPGVIDYEKQKVSDELHKLFKKRLGEVEVLPEQYPEKELGKIEVPILPVRGVPLPPKKPNPVEQLFEKWEKAKARNSALALKDLDALAAKGLDVSDCQQALQDYRDINRSDYDEQEDYKEARDEAWGEFLTCLDNLSTEWEEPTAEVEV